MDDRGNTIAGWVLAGGIAALGLSIVSGKYFHADKPERPETLGYVIEGVVSSDGAAEAEVPLATLLASADAARGERAFAKCAACHTINQGGANGIGPNLYGIMGEPHAAVAGFDYSDALKAISGPWNFEEMDAWLKSPRTYASGTKMTFAGLSKPEERADLLLYLNANGPSPLPLPTPPAAEAAPADEAGADDTAGDEDVAPAETIEAPVAG